MILAQNDPHFPYLAKGTDSCNIRHSGMGSFAIEEMLKLPGYPFYIFSQRARQESMLRASHAAPANSDTNLIDIRSSPSDDPFDPLEGRSKIQQQQQLQQQQQAQIAVGLLSAFVDKKAALDYIQRQI